MAISWQRYELVLCWLCFFCDYVLMTMAIPIFPLLGASDSRTGVLFAGKAAFQILCSPAMTLVVDKIPKRLLLMAGLMLEIVSLLIFACSFDLLTYAFARAISGIGSAAIMSAGMAHLKETFIDVEQRATAMGIATTGIIGGVCVGPLFGGSLFQLWRPLPWLALALVDVALLVLFAVGRRVQPLAASDEPARLARRRRRTPATTLPFACCSPRWLSCACSAPCSLPTS